MSAGKRGRVLDGAALLHLLQQEFDAMSEMTSLEWFDSSDIFFITNIFVG
jgi:hypothetical protein